MATSTQRAIFTSLTYNDEIKTTILRSGGTVIFTKDNILVASEVSEAQYRELLKSPYIDKIDILPLKRYRNDGITYIKNDNVSNIRFTDVTSKNIIEPITTSNFTPQPNSSPPSTTGS
jgi:hypothetical protein